MGAARVGHIPLESDAHEDPQALTQDLERSLLLALCWTSRNLRHFRLGIDLKSEITKETASRLKPISELALATAVLSRYGIKLPFIEQLRKWMWRESQCGRVLARLLLARNDFLPCCSFYASMFQLGLTSEVLDAIIKALARTQAAEALPLQPWTKLALTYSLKKLGICDSPNTRSDLYVNAWPEPWVMSGEIAYAVTHELFYLTDFGFEQVGDPGLLNFLQTWIPYWTALFQAERNCDLVAELVMASQCIQRKGSKEIKVAIQYLIANQSKDGSIRGPIGAGSFLRRAGDTRSRRRFLARYHTTLVSAMALVMVLSSLKRETYR